MNKIIMAAVHHGFNIQVCGSGTMVKPVWAEKPVFNWKDSHAVEAKTVDESIYQSLLYFSIFIAPALYCTVHLSNGSIQWGHWFSTKLISLLLIPDSYKIGYFLCALWTYLMLIMNAKWINGISILDFFCFCCISAIIKPMKHLSYI